PKLIDGQEELLVGVSGALLVIQMAERAERLDVVLHVAVPVESFRHEMRTVVLMQQSAWHHLDAGRKRHSIVRIFNAPVVFRRTELEFGTDAIKFQEPMLEAGHNV